jgi:nicotinamidase/pyrazinamidase
VNQKVGILVVDIQGDFTTLKNGALAVAGTDQAYLDRVRQASEALRRQGYRLFATQDWHPADHVSFYTSHPGRKAFDVIDLDGREQILWPPHCVQGTEKAGLLLDEALFAAVVRKGMDRRYDSYSGFQDDGGAPTELNRLLKTAGIEAFAIYGLTTDYCVRATSLDGVAAGYRVTVIEGLCRGVAPDTTLNALEEMAQSGVIIKKELDSELF